MSDDQDAAETFDEDALGTDDAVTSDEAETDADWPPTRTHGVQFADADVTDESFAERTAQEEPEVDAADLDLDLDVDPDEFERDVADANVADD